MQRDISSPVVELDHEVEEVGFPEVGGRLLGVLGPPDPASEREKLGSFPIGHVISYSTFFVGISSSLNKVADVFHY